MCLKTITSWIKPHKTWSQVSGSIFFNKVSPSMKDYSLQIEYAIHNSTYLKKSMTIRITERRFWYKIEKLVAIAIRFWYCSIHVKLIGFEARNSSDIVSKLVNFSIPSNSEFLTLSWYIEEILNDLQREDTPKAIGFVFKLALDRANYMFRRPMRIWISVNNKNLKDVSCRNTECWTHLSLDTILDAVRFDMDNTHVLVVYALVKRCSCCMIECLLYVHMADTTCCHQMILKITLCMIR